MASGSTIAPAHRFAAALALVTCTLACSSQGARPNGAPTATAGRSESRAPAINHLTPRRDSVGEMPSRFAWTPIEGADLYMVGIYGEAGMLVWQHPEVRAASFDWTEKTRLDPGTYFWSVTAMRGGQPIAESGRAAFVVK